VKTAYAGQHEKADRSDCMVSLSLKKSGGRSITVNSKVKLLFEKAIRTSITNVLDTFSIEHADVTIDDNGAPDYVITARLEACIKQLKKTDLEYLPEMLEQNSIGTEKDRMRRSRLYLPGNTPKLALNAGLHGGDGIILDLEDSVAPGRKDEARILVRNSLRAVDFYGAERMVRINQGERGLKDLDAVIPHHANLILLPKCESAEQLLEVDKRIRDQRIAKRGGTGDRT
jgi:citrate lyase subunit beta/citryl-CoA lyase